MKSDHPCCRSTGILEKTIAIIAFLVSVTAITVIVNLPSESIVNASNSIIEKGGVKSILKAYAKEKETKQTSAKVEVRIPSVSEAKKERAEVYLEFALTELTVKNITESKEIDYKTQVIKTSQLKKGETKIITKGEKGLKITSKNVTYKGETLYDTEVVHTKTLKKPTTQVVLQGIESTVPIFMVPSKGTYSSYYGMRWGRMHKGVDIAASTGTFIKASEGGKVTFSGEKSGYGKCIIIKHKNGYETLYAHANKLMAKKGDTVYKGQTIAEIGSTGRSTGPHLHFEVRVNGTHKDPMTYLKGK